MRLRILETESGINRNYFLIDLDLEPDLGYSNQLMRPERLNKANLMKRVFRDEQQYSKHITNNQLAIISYFLIRNSIPSVQLITQWLIDAGCDHDIANLIAENLFIAKIESIDDELSYYSEESCTQFNDIVQRLKNGNNVKWMFDNVEPQSSDHENKIINISKLKEALFRIEDHNCLIIGLANSCFSLIELLEGYDSSLSKNLCELLPIGIRDRYAVGRALIAYPQLLSKIMTSKVSNIELYGLDLNGILRKYPEHKLNSFDKFFNQVSINDESNRFIPIYIKLNKRH